MKCCERQTDAHTHRQFALEQESIPNRIKKWRNITEKKWIHSIETQTFKKFIRVMQHWWEVNESRRLKRKWFRTEEKKEKSEYGKGLISVIKVHFKVIAAITWKSRFANKQFEKLCCSRWIPFFFLVPFCFFFFLFYSLFDRPYDFSMFSFPFRLVFASYIIRNMVRAYIFSLKHFAFSLS